MARPIKEGLDYFPLDVTLDSKWELLEADCGLHGFAIITKLYQKVYSTGYYIKWNEDEQLLFSKRINTEETLVNSVITMAIKRGLFDKSMYEKYQILTSRGIQKRYFEIVKQLKRKGIEINKNYLLINKKTVNTEETTEDIGVITEKMTVNAEETTEEERVNTEFSTQKKRKERKGKESKINDTTLNYTTLVNLYKFINKEEANFENITEAERGNIIFTLKKLGEYPENRITDILDYPVDMKMRLLITYWVIKEIRCSPRLLQLNKIENDRDMFITKYLLAIDYTGIDPVNIDTEIEAEDEELKRFISYFIKSLRDEFEGSG